MFQAAMTVQTSLCRPPGLWQLLSQKLLPTLELLSTRLRPASLDYTRKMVRKSPPSDPPRKPRRPPSQTPGLRRIPRRRHPADCSRCPQRTNPEIHGLSLPPSHHYPTSLSRTFSLSHSASNPHRPDYPPCSPEKASSVVSLPRGRPADACTEPQGNKPWTVWPSRHRLVRPSGEQAPREFSSGPVARPPVRPDPSNEQASDPFLLRRRPANGADGANGGRDPTRARPGSLSIPS